MPLNKKHCPRWREKFASGLAPAGIQAMVQKQEKKLRRLICFSKKYVYFRLCDSGDFYLLRLPWIILPYKTALATPLTLFDLQVGDPNPYIPIKPRQICRVGREFALKRKSDHRLSFAWLQNELNLASLALSKIPREELLVYLSVPKFGLWTSWGRCIAVAPFT